MYTCMSVPACTRNNNRKFAPVPSPSQLWALDQVWFLSVQIPGEGRIGYYVLIEVLTGNKF